GRGSSRRRAVRHRPARESQRWERTHRSRPSPRQTVRAPLCSGYRRWQTSCIHPLLQNAPRYILEAPALLGWHRGPDILIDVKPDGCTNFDVAGFVQAIFRPQVTDNAAWAVVDDFDLEVVLDFGSSIGVYMPPLDDQRHRVLLIPAIAEDVE